MELARISAHISTPFLPAQAALPGHRSLKNRNCSEGLLQLRVTDMNLDTFVTRKEKAIVNGAAATSSSNAEL